MMIPGAVMHLQTVKAIAAIKHLNQSDLAAAANVSRQRVSQWFKSEPADGYVNIQTDHLRAIATALGVDATDLLKQLPLLDDPHAAARYTTTLLWDRLYPDLVSLFAAALGGERDALARVVQVFGLHAAAKLIGPSVWRGFPRYKSLIKPARRTALEHIWQYRFNQTNG